MQAAVSGTYEKRQARVKKRGGRRENERRKRVGGAYQIAAGRVVSSVSMIGETKQRCSRRALTTIFPTLHKAEATSYVISMYEEGKTI